MQDFKEVKIVDNFQDAAVGDLVYNKTLTISDDMTTIVFPSTENTFVTHRFHLIKLYNQHIYVKVWMRVS